jgi:hypothetical protein
VPSSLDGTWISRETWRKVLPWSRAPRFRLVEAVVFTAAALLVTAAAAPLSAQAQPAEAVLLSGPTAVKGIPVFTPNRIPAYRGEYSLEGVQEASQGEAQEGARTVRVLYTRQDLLIPQTWNSRRCGVRSFYRISDYETFTLCYRDDQGFSLFFFFPEIEEPAYWCDFADPFVERFLFLSNFVDSEEDVPFPAILQLD